MQGQLTQKPIIKLFRQLSEKKANGLLRVTRGKTIKAIFFEAGNPVFAISNSAQEQIEYKLLQEKLVSSQQIEQARTLTDKPNKISAKLIEIGAVQPEILQKSVRDLVKGIIYSLMDWNEGEYVFDEKMRAAHEIKLDHDATEILLEAGRQISKNSSFSQVFLPVEMVVVRTSVTQNLFDTGKLVPIESYILSRIDSPTVVQDVGAMSGLPEEEAYRALCALAASGFLRSLQDEDDLNEGQISKTDIENLKQEIINKTNFFSQANYYEILDVADQSTMAEIKAAYYNLAKKFHPDRFRQAEYTELRHQLESMFAKITQAYETLSASGSRSAYDSRIRKEKKSAPLPKVSKPLTTPIPIPLTPSTKMDDKHRGTSADQGSHKESSSDGSSRPAETKEEASKVASKPAVEKTAANTGNEVKQGDNNQMAERYYQQGRSRIDKKDYSSAIQLLREAVKLEPGKSHYHFYLGSALIRSPRNRREAEDHLAKAAKLDQFNTNLRIKIGMLFKESGNRPKADLYFKDALSLDPDNRIAKRELRMDGQSKGSGMPLWKQDVGSIAKRLFKRG